MKEQRGITLIALVITIIVLLILAGVGLSLALNQEGVISKSKMAANVYRNAETDEQIQMNTISEQWGELTGEKIKEVDKSSLEELAETGTFVTENKKIVKDKYDNKVVVPKGFKVVRKTNDESIKAEGDVPTVQEGVVIEDKIGNQFVWIPIGVVTKNDGTKTNDIKLARYEPIYTNVDGTYKYVWTPKQYAENYTNSVVISSYFTQPTYSYNDGINGEQHNGPLDLKGFLESATNNGGYYMARYEASHGGGSKKAEFIPLSKPSTDYKKTDYDDTTIGALYGLMGQVYAAPIAINMYKDNDEVGVISDLPNSYAYDTTLTYINEFDSEYIWKTAGTVNTNKANTGENDDVACNIHDLVGNQYEHSTELSSYQWSGSGSNYKDKATIRGGTYYFESSGLAWRHTYSTSGAGGWMGFRVMLYIKD